MSRILLDLSESVTGSKGVVVAIVAVLVLVFCCVQRYQRGLHHIPGPFLASISSFHRLISTARANIYNTHLRYHRQCGLLVRVGPNHVSFADPEALPVVYGVNTRFEKSGVLPPLRRCHSDRSAANDIQHSQRSSAQSVETACRQCVFHGDYDRHGAAYGRMHQDLPGQDGSYERSPY